MSQPVKGRTMPLWLLLADEGEVPTRHRAAEHAKPVWCVSAAAATNDLAFEHLLFLLG